MSQRMTSKEMVGGCCVCSDERGWTENPLVYCDGNSCNVAVHQACYGIVQVPTGPWFCRKCESQERQARVRCELCPSKDGALKRTDNNGWAHVVCALYIPEVRFDNVTTMEPIVLRLVPPERYHKTCYICEEQGRESKSSIGACMQCNKPGCKHHFHVTCAQAAGLLCEEAGNYNDNVKYCGYCAYHYQKLKKDGSNIKHIPAFKPAPAGDVTPDSSPDKRSLNSSSFVSPNGTSSSSESAKLSKKKSSKSSGSNSLLDTSSSNSIPNSHASPSGAAISRSNDSIIETKIKPEKKRKRTSTSTCANSSSPSPSNASSTPVTSNAAQMASHFSKSSSHVPTLHPSSATPNVSNFSNTSSSSSITNSKHESNKPKKDVTSTKRAKRKKDDSAKDSNMDSLTTTTSFSKQSVPNKPSASDKTTAPRVKKSSSKNSTLIESFTSSRSSKSQSIKNIAMPNPPTAKIHASTPPKESSEDTPQALELLLERQWTDGARMVMEQAQPFDIASLLSCLYQLKNDNERLDKNVSQLVARINHLLSVNSRLSLPLNSTLASSPLNSANHSSIMNSSTVNTSHQNGSLNSVSSSPLSFPSTNSGANPSPVNVFDGKSPRTSPAINVSSNNHRGISGTERLPNQSMFLANNSDLPSRSCIYPNIPPSHFNNVHENTAENSVFQMMATAHQNASSSSGTASAPFTSTSCVRSPQRR